MADPTIPPRPDGIITPYPKTWDWERMPGQMGVYRRNCCWTGDDVKMHTADCPWFIEWSGHELIEATNKVRNAMDAYVVAPLASHTSAARGTLLLTPEEEDTKRLYLELEVQHAARSATADRICASDGVLAQAVDHFLMRNRGYGDGARNLGIRGQFADLNRKMLKLQRYVWDGEEVAAGEESVKVIAMELIGHVLLMLDELEESE